MKVSTRRSHLTINAICQTVKVNTSFVTYAQVERTAYFQSQTTACYSYLFLRHTLQIQHIEALLNQVFGLLTCLWQGAPGYTADESLATPPTIPVPTWHLRANLSVHQEPPATNKFKILFTYILMRIFSSLLHRVATTHVLDQHMWLSTHKSRVCLSNIVKTQQFSTCKQWRFRWLVSHLPTVGGKQTNGQIFIYVHVPTMRQVSTSDKCSWNTPVLGTRLKII